MLTIDAQVHAYERNHLKRPWVGSLEGPDEVTGQDMVAAMDKVGVDAALLVSPWTMYRFDASYATQVHKAYPGRFGLIKPIDLTDAGLVETIEEWALTQGAVAIRIMMGPEVSNDPKNPSIKRALKAAAMYSLPVNLLCWGRLSQVEKMASQNPNTRLIIDHLGLQQPFQPPAPKEPFKELPALLNLAKYENIAVKITGACTLSHQSFPYLDLWDPLGQIFDKFSFHRCMWGTDWTRALRFLTYREGVEAFRFTDQLSDSEKANLMGKTLQNIYGWSPYLE